jgi:hypothetical protein
VSPEPLIPCYSTSLLVLSYSFLVGNYFINTAEKRRRVVIQFKFEMGFNEFGVSSIKYMST